MSREGQNMVPLKMSKKTYKTTTNNFQLKRMKDVEDLKIQCLKLLFFKIEKKMVFFQAKN